MFNVRISNKVNSIIVKKYEMIKYYVIDRALVSNFFQLKILVHKPKFSYFSLF